MRADCGAQHADTVAHVSRVFDGDTVLLNSGVHVRLIGLDTPELAHRQRPADPLADDARRRLEGLLARSGWTLRLRFDVERRDHYGRTLAHAYLPDGTSVSAALLRYGLATALVVPPNLAEAACYQRAEAQARAQRAGLWALARYQPVASTALPKRAHGFHIVHGRVVHVGFARRAVWINLEGHVALRIDRRDLAYFREIDLRRLEGTQISARGWVHASKGERRISIRHPLALGWDQAARRHVEGASRMLQSD
ncbi:hypothetical protein BI364_00250 [Acidihalobacter yilgarnensis]|uniref:TNase-like domain-containing protein n=1 Tax=Acidihalobacter yilgarnensis TaxID=2819280 RepID=A0A1D8IJK1_9GAMM|nr:thermonuclease family protein [Acidihalobacter yilgarnensis]AOU96660.1 hypothetical protein BI364_00250 [Acidihalobacter yilgarnensis]